MSSSRMMLRGWLEVPRRQVSKNLRFFNLRTFRFDDPRQVVKYQLVSRHPVHSDLARSLSSITSESCVEVEVERSPRPLKDRRGDDLETQDYNIMTINVLNSAHNLPFQPSEACNVEPVARASNRHIELRSDELGHALRERASIKRTLQTALDQQGFIEVETPVLFKSTPEGAREFIVPTRNKGKFFALTQSPQQYKQILMAGGLNRYFQFAKCFRDEDGRADRQLEFTQLDLEMSFADEEEVMTLIETIMRPFANDSSKNFARITYTDAMLKFGSDKPDIRFGLPIENHYIKDDVVDLITYQTDDHDCALSIVNTLAKDLEVNEVFALYNGNVPSDFAPITEILTSIPSAIHFVHRRKKTLNGGSTPMGRIRLALQALLEDLGRVKKRNTQELEFLWVTDFPLFTLSESEQITSTHHPFTAPRDNDIAKLDHEPLEVKGKHYDLVVNGVEIGGGSIRIHDAKLQRKVLKMLNSRHENDSRFDHLLRVLSSGCPPHGGFALGFDRFCMLRSGKTSVRDVIAFPKTSRGADLLVGSPSELSAEELSTYHLQFK